MEALKTVWNFIQDEVLGMNWLDRLLATILNAVGLDTTGKIGSSIHFFIASMKKFVRYRVPDIPTSTRINQLEEEILIIRKSISLAA